MSQINNAERLYDWAQQVMQVEFVKLINKRFGGLALHDERDAKSVVTAIDALMQDVTHVENISELGLGAPIIRTKEQTVSNYTPTKLEVRSQYANDSFGSDEYLIAVAEFDRWLEAHNAEVVKETEERIIKLFAEIKNEPQRKPENWLHKVARTAFADAAVKVIKGEQPHPPQQFRDKSNGE